MSEKSLKIILVGSRYTGKGQIGRSWAKTDADLPTLQPVILYERMVSTNGEFIRVVIWVLSFDEEFLALRSAFYDNPKPDGIIFTYDICDPTAQTIKDMNQFKEEIINKNKNLPPSALLGIRLTNARKISTNTINSAEKWALENEISDINIADYSDREKFNETVEKIILTLVEKNQKEIIE